MNRSVQCQVFYCFNFFFFLFIFNFYLEHLMTGNGGFLEMSGGGRILSLTQRTRTAYCGGVILKRPRAAKGEGVHMNMKICSERTLLKRP